MRESNILAGNAPIKQLESLILLVTKGHMKESDTLADSVVNYLLKSQVLLFTKRQYMEESDTLAINAAIRQLQSLVLLNTEEQYMKE